jgi:hypothetical protein
MGPYVGLDVSLQEISVCIFEMTDQLKAVTDVTALARLRRARASAFVQLHSGSHDKPASARLSWKPDADGDHSIAS